MSTATVTTLTADHLPAAAELLAARQRMLRAPRPELPVAFEEPDAHLDSLAAALAESVTAFAAPTGAWSGAAGATEAL